MVIDEHGWHEVVAVIALFFLEKPPAAPVGSADHLLVWLTAGFPGSSFSKATKNANKCDCMFECLRN